jgi:hypothetical protein
MFRAAPPIDCFGNTPPHVCRIGPFDVRFDFRLAPALVKREGTYQGN